MDPDSAAADSGPSTRSRWRRAFTPVRVLLALLGAVLVLAVVVATFPVGWARSWMERELSDSFGAPVQIGGLSREPFFSFAPTIVVSDLRIAQPRWAGSGDLAKVQALRLRVPILPALIGRGLQPDAIEARGLALALVRDAKGRSNWGGRRKSSGGGSGMQLSDLSITDGRFTLRDLRRHLNLTGQIVANRSAGLVVRAAGQFHESPAKLSLTGGPIVNLESSARYPFTFTMDSPRLRLVANGTTQGALNMRDMEVQMAARAPSLKDLDDIIQAGLFGTQPIDLKASARHKGRDWFVDKLAGSVGRSQLTGHATILKRDGRSKIDGTIDFAQLDFDDLASDEGKAKQAALKAQIGPRVLPNTRINLSKLGPTDGVLHFNARRLLFKNESVFRSLKGVIKLDHKLVTVETIEAGLTNGRMTGRVAVDHREGASPLLGVDLLFSGGRLGALLGATDTVDAPFRARVVLHGRGDTIRAALSHADGHAGLAAGEGSVSRLAAAVLGQDMGKAIGAALGKHDEKVPLRCIAVGFDAHGGRLATAPFLVDTATGRSRGTGTITLDGETIALEIGGRARNPSGLAIVDPIKIDGTLSAPVLSLADVGRGTGVGGILGAVVKSIGGALGLADKKGPQVNATGPIDCAGVSAQVLRGAD